MNISEAKLKAIQSIEAAGGVLDYQRGIKGFGVLGCEKTDRIVIQKANQLINMGLIEASRFVVDRKGNAYIDQIILKIKK